MLQSLHIVNFAIIEDTIIELTDGATVFTGETGAGKSILIDALAMLLGRRARTDLIRTGAEFFKVEGIFSVEAEMVSILASFGFDAADSQIIITRKLNRSGRGICTINGDFCTVKQLELIGRKLVHLHEQSDTIELLSSKYCRKIIDRLTPEIAALRDEYDHIYQEWQEAKNFLEEFYAHRQENERRIDILEWELDQIRAANITNREDEEIDKRLSVLQNYEKIIYSIKTALSTISDEGGARDLLASASKAVSTASRYDKEMEEIDEALRTVLYSLEDIEGKLDTYISTADFSHEELSELQSRSNILIGLKRKFGPTLADVIHYEENAEKEYTRLKNLVYENKEMQEKYELLTEAAMKKAGELNQQRILIGREFTEKIISLLRDMGMDDPRMTLHLVPATVPVSSGVEEMELYFSANRGESLRSMKETASGGELSRIALAIEIIASELMRGQTLVFDEIDVGISGKIGIQIAKKIRILAKSLQVLIITHLPQTASITGRHYKIEKIISSGQTFSKAILLEGQQQIENVAQMISGTSKSENAIQSALEIQKMLSDN